MESRFSTRVTAPDGRSWGKVRVLVTDTEAHVFQPDATGSPELVATVALSRDPVEVAGRWYLPAEDGNWEALGPCGCSSPAKRWDERMLAALVPS